MDAEGSLYDEEESKFQDYNDDDDFLEVQQRYNNDSDDGSSVSTYKKKQRKLLKQFESTDKGYRNINIYLNNRKKSIDLYATNNCPGTVIKDAATGAKMNQFRVGSLDEQLFFKAKLTMNGISPSSDIYFFDNPEQYERIFHTNLSQQIKDNWANKFMEIKDKLKNT
jgi:hypothetical protein